MTRDENLDERWKNSQNIVAAVGAVAASKEHSFVNYKLGLKMELEVKALFSAEISQAEESNKANK